MVTFEWDNDNLRKLVGSGVNRKSVEFALRTRPIMAYRTDVAGEPRYLYYGESGWPRALGIVVTRRDDAIRVITAFPLDPKQQQVYWWIQSSGWAWAWEAWTEEAEGVYHELDWCYDESDITEIQERE